jgi:23S rRNA (pseudouridine1915-N3)-methyltransferase
MKLTLLFTGKTEEAYLKEGIGIYTKRLRHYIPHEIKIVDDRKKRPEHREGRSKAGKSEKLIPEGNNNAYYVLLDEKGDKLSSEEFARFIENTMVQGYKELVFITGGAYGFSENAYRRANRLISLSDMTFTNQMVRLILVEQIYRAMTIIRGEPYHHQ